MLSLTLQILRSKIVITGLELKTVNYIGACTLQGGEGAIRVERFNIDSSSLLSL
jgi:hypothetical protein